MSSFESSETSNLSFTNVEEVIFMSACCTSQQLGSECIICMDEITQSAGIILPICGHIFHEQCAANMLKANGKCAQCQHHFLQQIGTQPKNGVMSTHIYPPGSCPLAGNEQFGTISIRYNFPNGTQGREHPNPGRRYHGTSRQAYLPDTPEGHDILRLLTLCFNRRLTFTIGTSITTGQSDCVVWNGVHHKTNTHGGSSHFGFPDPTYFSRVKDELRAKGIY